MSLKKPWGEAPARSRLYLFDIFILSNVLCSKMKKLGQRVLLESSNNDNIFNFRGQLFPKPIFGVRGARSPEGGNENLKKFKLSNFQNLHCYRARSM